MKGPRAMTLEVLKGASQRAQRWRPRAMTQGAMLKEVANSKLRRPLAHNETFPGMGVEVPPKWPEDCP